MKKIQMVDLQSQYYKIKADVDNAVLNVLDSAAFINGPEVKSFQNELEQYLDVKHVIPCANGTDALQIALMALDLKEGDVVVLTYCPDLQYNEYSLNWKLTVSKKESSASTTSTTT